MSAQDGLDDAMGDHLPNDYQQPPFAYINMAQIQPREHGLVLEPQPTSRPLIQDLPMASTAAVQDQFQPPVHGLTLPTQPMFGPADYGFAMSSTGFFPEQVQSTDHAYVPQGQLASRPLHYPAPLPITGAYQNQVQPVHHGLMLQTQLTRPHFYPSFHMLNTYTSQDDFASLPNMSHFYQAGDRRPDIVPTIPGMNLSTNFVNQHNHASHARGPSTDATFRTAYMHSSQAPETRMTVPSPSQAWSHSPSPIDCKPALLRQHSLVTAPHLPSFETDMVSGNLLAPAQGVTQPSCFCNKRDNYAMVACGAPNHNGPKWFHLECVGLAGVPPSPAPASHEDSRDVFESFHICRSHFRECQNATDEDIAANVVPIRSPHTTAPIRTPQPRKNRRQQGLVTPQRKSRSVQKVQATSSRKSGRRPTQNKRKGSTWSAREEDICIKIMKKVKNSGVCNRIDELWGEVSKRMEQEYGVIRSAAGVKNAWNRNLRAKSRFDERANPKPQMLRTGLLGTAKKKHRSKNDDSDQEETTSSYSSDPSVALEGDGSDEDDIYEL